MRPVTSFGIQFQLRHSRTLNNHAPLTVRITVDGERKNMSLEHKVNVNNWLSKEEKLKGNDTDTKNLNCYIEELRAKLYEAKRQLILEQIKITPDAIWNKFLGKNDNDHTLLSVITYHNETMKNTLAWGTAKNYYTTEKYVKEFLKVKLKTSDVFLTQLNYKFITDFEMFLRSHVPGENQKPCGNNTVMKHIERFRKITSMAVRNDWLKQDPFMKFKPNFIKKDRGYLTEEELKIIEDKEISIARIEVVRDLFVFSCYTGLTYGDAASLNSSNINIGIDGRKWIVKRREKTGVQANLPLLPKALEILDKYKNHPRCIEKNILLPMIANQPFNSFLKEVAIICGINKNLTHHLARHTFATTVCLLNGISMEATSGMLGHASMRTTQIYGKILPQRISREMELLQKKFAVDSIKLDNNTGS
jgi:site-specific recombinase XerD